MRSWRLLLILFLLVSLGPAQAPQPAAAADCAVTNTNDSGVGSLREQLADPACAAITFSLPGGGPWAITLASDLPAVTRVASVTGPGAASLTIDRNDIQSGTAFPVG